MFTSNFENYEGAGRCISNLQKQQQQLMWKPCGKTGRKMNGEKIRREEGSIENKIREIGCKEQNGLKAC